jgi:hypothetical protein
MLVDSYGATMRFRGAREVARTRLYRLLQPSGRPRLALYGPGRYFDGWLATEGSFRVWPAVPAGRVAGWLSFSLSLPSSGDPVVVRLSHPGGRQIVSVRPGVPTAVTLSACSPGPWQVHFSAPFTGSIGPRFVSVRSTEPVFRPDAGLCP